MYRGKVTFNAKTMYVPVKINNRHISAVIDSGAQVSVLSKNFFHNLDQRPILTDTVYIKGIGSSPT